MDSADSIGDGELREPVAEQCASAPNHDQFPHLIRQARDGSDDALDELIRTCQSYLLLIANQELATGVQGKLGASDAVQSALALAHQNLVQFRGESKEELLGWLRQILRNEINAVHRRYATEKRNVHREIAAPESGHQQVAIIDDRRTPQTEAVFEEEAAALRQALGKLPTDYRAVVALRNWEQLPFDEVGRRMNRSTEAVKKLWTRAMRRLKKELNNEGSRESS